MTPTISVMRKPRVNVNAKTLPAPICYICVRPGADDKDHLIPSAFFPPPRQDNLITLPAHHSCHDRLSEDYARAVLTGFSDTWTATVLRTGEIRRSLVRSDLGGMYLRRDLIRTLVPRFEFRSPAGLILGAAPGIRFDRNRVYPLLEKIVRGLHYHHTGRFLATNAQCYWAINEQPFGPLEDVFAQAVQGLTYQRVFECRYSIRTDDFGETVVWWLRFYEGVIFRCATNTGSLPPLDAGTPPVSDGVDSQRG